MAKRSRRSIPKRMLEKVGNLKRVGTWPNKEWKFMGETFKTLRSVWLYYLSLKPTER